MSLGHVYIVLEPVGSARLTFGDDLYYELCDLMTEDSSESRMRSGTWRGVSDEIGDMMMSLEMVEM